MNPIISSGIIAFKEDKVLMIQRKDSIAFSVFVRGKYPEHDREYLKKLLRNMTEEEQGRLMNEDFNTLWNSMFSYSRLSHRAEDRFRAMKETAIDVMEPGKSRNEWGFPKGQLDKNENVKEGAIREFYEETGIKEGDLDISDNFVVEDIIGMDGKHYRYIYFLAEILGDVDLGVNSFHQKLEIRDIRMAKTDEAFDLLDSDIRKEVFKEALEIRKSNGNF